MSTFSITCFFNLKKWTILDTYITWPTVTIFTEDLLTAFCYLLYFEKTAAQLRRKCYIFQYNNCNIIELVYILNEHIKPIRHCVTRFLREGLSMCWFPLLFLFLNPWCHQHYWNSKLVPSVYDHCNKLHCCGGRA